MSSIHLNTKQSRFAIVSLLVLNTAVLLFHIAIVTKIAPYNIAWGGSLKTDSEMYVFEAISILINLLFSFTLLIKGNFIRPLLSSKTVQVLLWIFFVIYALNTVGNLFAVTSFEKYFAILTFLFAFLIGLIIFKKKLS